jgi:1-acyl-sn-glycerol-3-phosphate acyltransferase
MPPDLRGVVADRRAFAVYLEPMATEQLSTSPPVEWPVLPAPLAVTGRTARRFGALAGAWWRLRQEPLVTRRTAADWLAVAERLQEVTSRLCADNNVVFEVRGARPPAGSVIVANHLSYVDTLVLPSLLPSTCIAKREVADWPVIGPMTERLGVLFVDRGSVTSGARVLRQAIRALEAGVAVIAFPEGTTSLGHSLLPFRRGIFGAARRLGVPVVAAALSYDDDAVAWTGDAGFLGHYVRGVAGKRSTTVRMCFSAPIDPHAWPNATALADAARGFISRQLFGR